MNAITSFFMKHKKSYLMIGGTLLPAIGAYTIAKSLKAGEATKNLAAVAGLVIGGMLTAKMLKN